LGQQWTTKTALRGRLPGGFEVVANVVGRRGYDRPLFMSESLGSDSIAPNAAPYYVDTSGAPVLWETELRARKRLKSAGSLQIDFVGEAFNTLCMNAMQNSSPVSSPTFHSRTLRFGFVFSWDSQKKPNSVGRPSPVRH
jgi:hypothetical protein